MQLMQKLTKVKLCLKIILMIIWGIYTLIYGLLLRKLKANYKEIKRLEI